MSGRCLPFFSLGMAILLSAYSPSRWLWFGADEVAQMNQTRLDTSSRDLYEGHRHVADGICLYSYVESKM